MWHMASLALFSASGITDQVSITALQSTGGVVGIIWYILLALALWRVFTKAGRAGILAIIPIVNVFVLVKIAGLSYWWVLLYLVPIVNIIFSIVVAFRIGRAFDKGGLFSFFFLWLISFIGYFIIGFGNSRYSKPV